MSRIYVIVPVHNRRSVTEAFVRTLRSQTISSFILVLVDDGSTDGTAVAVRQIVPNVIVLRGEGAWWWAGSLQQGLSWLDKQNIDPEDVVAICNDDMLLPPDFLESGLDLLRQAPGTIWLSWLKPSGDAMAEETGVEADLRSLRFKLVTDTARINCLSTRGLFLRWQDVLTTGRFRPRLLPHYLSDYEYTIRAGSRGIRLATSKHLWAQQNEEAKSDCRWPETLRARIRFLFSNRCNRNPLHWTWFVLMVSPGFWKVVNVIRVWRQAILPLLRLVQLRVQGDREFRKRIGRL